MRPFSSTSFPACFGSSASFLFFVVCYSRLQVTSSNVSESSILQHSQAGSHQIWAVLQRWRLQFSPSPNTSALDHDPLVKSVYTGLHVVSAGIGEKKKKSSSGKFLIEKLGLYLCSWWAGLNLPKFDLLYRFKDRDWSTLTADVFSSYADTVYQIHIFSHLIFF